MALSLRLLTLTFLLSGLSIVNAQFLTETDDVFQKLTVEDGLSQNTVNCILKDKTGFVWFGTNSGLNRFDSKELIVFEREVCPGVNLGNLHINDLYQDSAGILWIATNNGIINYDHLNDIVSKPFLLGVENDEPIVYCIEAENDSELWLGTSRGLKLLNKTTGLQQAYNHEPYQPNSLSSSFIYDLCNVGDYLWIGTSDGLDVLDKKKKSFNHYSSDINTLNSLPNNVIRSLLLDCEGNILIGTEHGGFAKYSQKNDFFLIYNTSNSLLPHNDIRSISQSDNGDIWIATNGGGVCKMNSSGELSRSFQHNPDKPEGLNSNSVYSVLEDCEGVLWVGTYTGGVNMNITRHSLFRVSRHIPFDKNSICENSVRSVFLDSEQNLWVGTLGGLSYYDSKTRSYKSFIHDDENPSSLSFNTVTTIFEDSRSNIWIGTYSGGLNKLNSSKSGFKHYSHNPKDVNSLSCDNIYAITEDKEGYLWVATSVGLSVYNPNKDNFERIGNLDVRDILILDSGDIALSITGGVAIYNPITGGIEYHTNEHLLPFPITSLYLQGENSLWLSSQGAGIAKFNLQTKDFVQYTKASGLPSDFVSSIMPYNSNQLWVSTYNGISLFDTKLKVFTNFSLSQGVPISEFHPKSTTYLPDGTLAFGGSKGLLYFNPNHAIGSQKESNLVLNSINIDNVSVKSTDPYSPLKRNINYTSSIDLNYAQNDFSFEFVDINFKNSGHSKYLYILENFSSGWQSIGEVNMVAFTNIKPGHYVFKVKTESSELIKEIEIHIKPPFWQTWYFLLLILLVLIVVLRVYNKYSLISIKQKNGLLLERLEYENQTELNQMRTRFFTYISHELRTPLTLIIDPLRKAIKKNENTLIDRDLQFVNKNTKRLLQLVDQIIDFRKLENDALKLQVDNISISEIVNDVYINFEDMAQSRDISYELESELGIDGWVDRDKIEKIMHNLLSNAFKFTPDNGNITVKLEAYDDVSVCIIIKDTGKGIAQEKIDRIFELFYQEVGQPKNMQGSFGLGLSYVHKLVKLHHGDIKVESIQREGSEFCITLPIVKDEYSVNERCVVIESTETANTETHIRRRELVQEHRNKETSFPDHDKATPKIVIVEDEVDLRDYFYISIAHKYKVYTAADGKEGLKLIKKVMPDLILSDNMMPEMSGVELCEAVKKIPDLEHIPFVLISAWNSDDQKIEGLKIGATDYISKPLDMDLLLAKISSILNDQKRLKVISKSKLNVNPEEPELESEDTKFLMQAKNIIEEHIDDSDFNSMVFETKLNMSHAVLYRRLKRLTGMSSNEFIREFRLKRAAQLIEKDKNLKVADVGFRVGYVDTKYFSQCFKKLFGVTPTEYKNKAKLEE